MATAYENKKTPIQGLYSKHLSPLPHLHNHLELVLMKTGTVRTVCDERTEELSDGGAFIAFPNQVHAYLPTVGKEDSIVIIFSPLVCREFRDLFDRFVPTASVVPRENLHPDILPLGEKLMDELKKNDLYSAAVCRGYLIALLGKLLPSVTVTEEKKPDGNLLKSIVNYCNCHYTEALSLDILARELHVGKYYISHIFSEKLNLSFSDYVNGLRINDAIQRLTESPDASITDIAYDCGFGSTRTFNRAFRKFTNTSPCEYRERNLYRKIKPINFYVIPAEKKAK